MKPVLVIQHVAHEGLGTIAAALRAKQVPWSTAEMFRQRPGAIDVAAHCGLIVLGGPMNVDQTQQYPYLADEVQWISEALDAGVPVLGVCLGSQLLAKAAGGRVYPNRSKEIGWYEVELTPAATDDLLLAGCSSPQAVFQWHGDTFELPPGAVQLARSADCERQAFRVGPSAWGLQFHLEVTAPMIESWLAEPGNCAELSELEYIDADKIRHGTPQRLPAMQESGRCVFGRFAQQCAARR